MLSTILTSVFTLMRPTVTQAATTNTLNFQARLQTAAGNIVPDGNYNVQFNLYTANTGGTSLWTETYLVSSSQGVRVKNGYLTANLGSVNPFSNSPTINWDQDLYLGITVRGTASCTFATTCTPADSEMGPNRLKLTAVPYAFRAGQLVTGNGTLQSSLSIVQPTVGNQIFQVPDMAAAGTYTLLTTTTANGAYIQNQIASPQSGSGFNTSGSGQVGTTFTAGGNINSSGGDILTGNTSRLTSGGSLQNITGFNQTSGGFISLNTTAAFKSGNNYAFQIQSDDGAPVFMASAKNSLNLLRYNPGLEVNAVGWNTSGTGTGLAMARDTTTTNVYDGQASLKVTTASGTASTGVKTPDFVATLTSSTVYTLSFFAKADTTGFSTLQAGMAYNGSTLTPCTLNSTTVSASGYQRYSCTFTSGTISGSPYIFIGVSDTVQHVFYIDDIDLHAGSTLPPYQIGTLDLMGVVTSPLALRNNVDSTTAFQIQNAAGTSGTFVVDTLNNVLFSSATLQLTNNINTSGNINISGGGIIISGGGQFQTGTGGVSLNGDVTVAAGKSLTLVGGTTSFPSSPAEGQMYYRSDNKQLYIYENGKWQADRTTATKIVAASDSQNKEKADFVAAGTNADEVAINNAIAALPASGGTVYLLDGNFTVGATIALPNNVTLTGSGASTTIKIKSGMAGNLGVITNSDSTNGNTGITVSNLKLDGNKANVTSGTHRGILFTKVGAGSGATAVQGAVITNVAVTSFNDSGMRFVTSNNNKITASSSANNGNHGIDLSSSDYNVVTNDITTGNTARGISLTTANFNSITANTSSGNTTNGILLSGGTKNTVTGNTTSGNGASGITLFSSANQNVVSSNVSSANTTLGYSISTSSTGNTLSNNTADSNTSSGFQTDASSTQNILTGNVSKGNTSSGYNIQSDDNVISSNSALTNGAYGFRVQGASNNNISFNRIADSGQVSASNDGINIDATSNSNNIYANTITDTAGTGFAIRLLAGGTNNTLSGNRYSGTGAASISDAATGTIYVDQVDASGNIINRGTASATSYMIQNASGNQVLAVDTSGNQLVLGKSSSLTGKLVFANGTNANTVTLQSGTTTTGYTLTLPTGAPGLGQCLQNDGTTVGQLTFGSCGGAGGVTTVNAITSTSQTNGATISGSSITFGAADINGPGMVTNGNQTFAGNKTFNGQIIGADRLVLSGTVTSSSNQRIQLTGNFNSSSTSSQYGFQNDTTFTPSGASLGNLYGISNIPVVSGTAINIGQVSGLTTSLTTLSDYTGQISSGVGLEVTAPTIGGTKLIPDYRGISISGNASNGGNTTGTINNYQLRINGNTAGAGAGGTLNNYGNYITMPSGTGGTTNNYGLYITGAPAGTSSYGIYSTTSAANYLSGNTGIGTLSTSTYNLNVNGSTNSSSYYVGNTAGSSATCSGTQAVLGQTIANGITTAGGCAAVATNLQTAYDNSGTGTNITLNTTNNGIKIKDAVGGVTGNLFQIQNNGGTSTLFGVSASGMSLQNSGGSNALTFDSVGGHLKIYNPSNVAQFADIYYDNATSTAVFAASTGTTRLGAGSGNINFALSAPGDVLQSTKTATLTSAYSGDDFTIAQNITSAGFNVTGSVLKVSANSSGSTNLTGNVLSVNQNNASAGGNLILATVGGSANKFAVNTAGTVSIAAGQSYTGAGAVTYTGAGAVTLSSGTSSTLLLQSGSGGGTIIKPVADSTTAFQVQDAGANVEMQIDTTNGLFAFGAAAVSGQRLNVRGTSTLNILNLQDNSANNVFTVGNNGTTTVKPSSASATAFQVQNTSSAVIFAADTSSNRLQVGSSTTDATAILLVLDSYNTFADPSGVNGAMYYNTSKAQYRCYRDGAWETCGTKPIDRAYIVEDEFLGGGTTTGTIGQAGWNMATIGTACTVSYNNTGTPAPSADRPGIMRCQTAATANTGSTFLLGSTTGGSTLISAGQTMKAGVVLGSTTAQVVEVGIHNETTSTTKPISGVWWEADASTNANWRYCYGNGTTATCTASGVAVTSNVFARLEIRVTATGSGTSAATFLINGNSYNVSGATITTSAAVSPAITNYTTTATARNFYVDYYQFRGDASAAR